MHYLTVASCVKGEPDLDDFILIHKLLGVEHFVFFDRDGDNLTDKFKGREDITVVKYPEPNLHHQSHLYVVNRFKGFSRFFALIDCDQVLFPVQTTDIKVALQEFEPYAQLQPVWQSFGNSGHEKRIEGSVYERFTKRAISEHGTNNHTQGIIDPTRCKSILGPDPHRCIPMDGQISVDENHRNVGITPHIEPHTQNKLFVAHYITKSREEWDHKNAKGRSDIPGEKMPYDLYDQHNAYMNEVEDTRIKDFWEKHCK